jgi:alcohol dehydrogenase class IV
MANPTDVDSRGDLLYGAALSGMALGATAAGLHHKICHVLGGMFNLPHAETHAVVLPHVLAYNAPSAPEAERRIAQGLGSTTAREGLRALRAQLDAPRALRDYGMPEEGIAKAVGPIMAAIPGNNPRTVTEDSLTALLQAAWAGEEPN